jgi:hypothetical protein
VQDEQSKKTLIIVENEQVVYGTDVMYYRRFCSVNESGFWFLSGSEIRILSCIVVRCVYLRYVDIWRRLVILYGLVVGLMVALKAETIVVIF